MPKEVNNSPKPCINCKQPLRLTDEMIDAARQTESVIYKALPDNSTTEELPRDESPTPASTTGRSFELTIKCPICGINNVVTIKEYL